MAKEEASNARLKGVVASALTIVFVVCLALAISTMIYGIINFPDAPIRKNATGFVNKQGGPRTAEDFVRFKRWEKVFIGSFAATFLLGFASFGFERRKTR